VVYWRSALSEKVSVNRRLVRKEITLARPRRLLALAVAALALLAAPGTAGAAIVNNGDFETGSLAGWQSSTTPDPNGSWVAYTGTESPINGITVPAPPQGNFAALTDQTGIGLRVLYQDITLPPGGSVNQLGLLAYYVSSAAIVSPDSLDPSGGANQQYRIDVMKPSAPLDSVAPGDVLVPVFRTLAGDPQTLDPTQKTVDLTALAGQTVRLRLAEVDNQLFFNAAADAISVKSNGFTIGPPTLNKKKGTARLPVTVPDPGGLKVSGKGVTNKAKLASKSVQVPGGPVTLLIKPNSKTKRKLNETGKAKVKVTITYTPTGVSSNAQKTKIKLKKKT
jgi:hypothetical protein